LQNVKLEPTNTLVHLGAVHKNVRSQGVELSIA